MLRESLAFVASLEEVAVIQNLVYYIERTYRTPDYGRSQLISDSGMFGLCVYTWPGS